MLFSKDAVIIYLAFRGVAQVVERYFREVEAASSSLVTPMKKSGIPMNSALFILSDYVTIQNSIRKTAVSQLMFCSCSYFAI